LHGVIQALTLLSKKKCSGFQAQAGAVKFALAIK